MIHLFNARGLGSSDTHKLPSMARLYALAMQPHKGQDSPLTVDPFARTCPWAVRRNDLNPQFEEDGFTTDTGDALEFLQSFETGTVDIVILDPPFSGRQSEEEYGTNNLYANPAYMVALGKECFRILKPNGTVLKCGFNSNVPARGFLMQALTINNMGASRNDIMMSLWMKTQMTLEDWSIDDEASL